MGPLSERSDGSGKGSALAPGSSGSTRALDESPPAAYTLPGTAATAPDPDGPLKSMLCQVCHKNNATVHITEIGPSRPDEDGGGGNGSPGPSQVTEKHLCQICAQSIHVNVQAVPKKTISEIWALLQQSAQKARRGRSVTCSRCGMTLEEFRRKGRLGCPECYRAFGREVGELLERVHGTRRHEGRIPGVSEEELDRSERLARLRRRLEVAVREEDYETAAKLRDEIQTIEARLESPAQSEQEGD